jgi:hypothetical protein
MKVRSPDGRTWAVRRFVMPEGFRLGPALDQLKFSWRITDWRGTLDVRTDVLRDVPRAVGVPRESAYRHGLEPQLTNVHAEAGLAAFMTLLFAPVLCPTLEAVMVGYRVLRGAPWPVEASTLAETKRWRVRGWDEAGRSVREIAAALQQGVYEPVVLRAERVENAATPATSS